HRNLARARHRAAMMSDSNATPNRRQGSIGVYCSRPSLLAARGRATLPMVSEKESALISAANGASRGVHASGGSRRRTLAGAILRLAANAAIFGIRGFEPLVQASLLFGARQDVIQNKSPDAGDHHGGREKNVEDHLQR